MTGFRGFSAKITINERVLSKSEIGKKVKIAKGFEALIEHG